MPLKIHIRDKGVCGKETIKFIAWFPKYFILLPYIPECGSKGQVHNLKIWTVASDLPWTPSRVRLPIEPPPPPIRIQQDGAWKGIGVIIEMLVSVLQTR